MCPAGLAAYGHVAEPNRQANCHTSLSGIFYLEIWDRVPKEGCKEARLAMQPPCSLTTAVKAYREPVLPASR